MLFRHCHCLKGVIIMNSPVDRLTAAKLKAEQEKRKRRMEARSAARREAAIHNRRCQEIGRIICDRFPQLQKYLPQHGDAVSDAVRDELVTVAEFLAANREVLDQIKAEALGGNSKRPSPQGST